MKRLSWKQVTVVPLVIFGMLVTSDCWAGAKAKPVSGPWEAGDFEFPVKQKKTRKSLSGIACNDAAGGEKSCLVVFDEGTQAHYVTLSPGGYAIDNTAVALRPSDDELDAEGAATDGEYYYVTGSHSVHRNSCEDNPGSRHVVRFALDPASGRAKYDAEHQLVDHRDTDALWRLMSSHPALESFVGERKCLGTERPRDAPNRKGKRGVNIEGLAARDGFLHFGFRGPARHGMAPVLTVGARALFERERAKVDVTFLKVGKGRGIRDLAPVKEGILVLAGPDDDKSNEKVGWTVGLWDGVPRKKARYRKLAKLSLKSVELRKCDDELKPEAIAILKDTPDTLDLVIMSDGMCDGGPLKFSIAR